MWILLPLSSPPTLGLNCHPYFLLVLSLYLHIGPLLLDPDEYILLSTWHLYMVIITAFQVYKNINLEIFLPLTSKHKCALNFPKLVNTTSTYHLFKFKTVGAIIHLSFLPALQNDPWVKSYCLSSQGFISTTCYWPCQYQS